VIKIVSTLFFIVRLVYCDDIDELISRIKQAPISQKRELINQLKLKLRTINSQKRLTTINTLRKNHPTIHTQSPHIKQNYYSGGLHKKLQKSPNR